MVSRLFPMANTPDGCRARSCKETTLDLPLSSCYKTKQFGYALERDTDDAGHHIDNQMVDG
jgi:hypothetical protein